jgi:hypothetical protein
MEKDSIDRDPIRPRRDGFARSRSQIARITAAVGVCLTLAGCGGDERSQEEQRAYESGKKDAEVALQSGSPKDEDEAWERCSNVSSLSSALNAEPENVARARSEGCRDVLVANIDVLDAILKMEPGQSSDFECDHPNAEVEWGMTGGDDTKVSLGEHEAFGCSFAMPNGQRVHCDSVKIVATEARWEPWFAGCRRD